MTEPADGPRPPRARRVTPAGLLAGIGHAAAEVVSARVRPALARRRVRLGMTGALLLLVAFLGTGWDYRHVPAAPPPASASPRAAREAQKLRAEQDRLSAGLRRKVPRGTWIVIDQTHNRLRLMRGDEQLLEAPCSAGSGMVLKEGSGGRVWVFDTPRGRFQVLSKIENPVWRKPDWAFVEEGEPIPRDPADRLEYGSLGAYALYFGNGYLIHGTLYERLLGRPVSHGCIRLGREPLREVYRLSPLGTPVYIY